MTPGPRSPRSSSRNYPRPCNLSCGGATLTEIIAKVESEFLSLVECATLDHRSTNKICISRPMAHAFGIELVVVFRCVDMIATCPSWETISRVQTFHILFSPKLHSWHRSSKLWSCHRLAWPANACCPRWGKPTSFPTQLS